MDSSIYASLPLQPGQIRLLRLLPDPDQDAPIHCSLFTYTLHNLDDRPHLYEALSYIWGDPNEVVEISVSGQPVNVALNLHAALRRLRDHYFDRIIWIDAICIDQRDKAETSTQILSVANIYGQASRVIVWLGEAADDSDVVLERIRAAESSQQLEKNQEDKALHQLLERSWFRRVWVLQEAAAARHIRILCGSKDLDGYAFCAGLQNLSKNETFHPIVHLIKRATFRSPHVSQILGRTSLSVYRLGHLLDLYHTYEASKRHDKVYALLGLSSDNLENAGLSPDYDVPWNHLLQRLLRHVLGRFVRIDTWQDREIAMINGRGYIIGDVTSAEEGHYTIRMDKTGKERKWTLPGSAKAVQCGDIVCLLQGASRATIIRLCNDHFAVVMIEVGSSVVENSEISESQYHFTLLWNWELSGGEWQNNLRDSTIKDALGQDHPEQELEHPQIKCARLRDIATILYNLRSYEQTAEILRRITREYKVTSGADNAQLLEHLEKLLVCYAKTEQRKEVDNVILQAKQIKRPLYGYQAGLWNKLECASPCNNRSVNWDKIRSIVHVLDLKQIQFTEVEFFDRVVDPDDGVVSLLLSKRTDLFRFAETVLFTLLTKALNKRQGDARIRQLLVGRNEGATQATERIIKLMTALQTGPAAIERIWLQQLIKDKNIKISKPKVARYMWYGNRDRVLMRALSQQKEEDVYVTKEIRAAAGGSPTRAVEILISSLQEPIRVTEQILEIGAAKSNTFTMEHLFRRKGKDVHIAEDVLKMAAEVNYPTRIDRLLRQNEESAHVIEGVHKAAAKSRFPARSRFPEYMALFLLYKNTPTPYRNPQPHCRMQTPLSKKPLPPTTTTTFPKKPSHTPTPQTHLAIESNPIFPVIKQPR